MFQLLQAANLQDKVSFMTLNVFGRTLSVNQPDAGQGRAHNGDHQVSVCIGSPFKGGVIGGCGPIKNSLASTGDFGALNIGSVDWAGCGGRGGRRDRAPGHALGVCPNDAAQRFGGCPSEIASGGTATVVTAALA